jgi:hypothetical protein
VKEKKENEPLKRNYDFYKFVGGDVIIYPLFAFFLINYFKIIVVHKHFLD